jgi:hypothetical protein
VVAAQLRELGVAELGDLDAGQRDAAGGRLVEAREMCMSVDLPEPDGPMIAVSWPRAISSVTPPSASTAVSPSP